MRTLAVIPARGGSKRLPGKNIRPFLGVPLIAWSIRFAAQIQQFSHIIVSTDDEGVAAVAEAEGLKIPYFRPAHLASDTASSAAVVLDILEREERAGRSYDLVALIQPTSPIRQAERWRKAYEQMANERTPAVVGVAPARDHPFHVFDWKNAPLLEPFTESAGRRLRSQDLPPAVHIAGNLYLIRSEILRQTGGFFPDGTEGVLCDGPCEAIDIDTETDWVVAETLAGHYGFSPPRRAEQP